MLTRSSQLREELSRCLSGGEKRARLLAQHNIPDEFVRTNENAHHGHQNTIGDKKSNILPRAHFTALTFELLKIIYSRI